jgi:hypothetical protein
MNKIPRLYHISARNSELGESRSESGAPFTRLSPGVPHITIHNRDPVAVDHRRALQEADWCERDVVCRALHPTLH